MENDKYAGFKRYRDAKYTQLSVAIPKDLANIIRDELAKDNKSFRQFVIECIDEYLAELPDGILKKCFSNSLNYCENRIITDREIDEDNELDEDDEDDE